MALFKSLRGKREKLPSTKTDGYAYFCTDDGSFHIDYLDDSGVVQRKQINAAQADSLTTLRCIDGLDFDGSKDVTRYITCTTSASTAIKSVSSAQISTGNAGGRISVKFTNANTAENPKLAANSYNNSPIYWNGEPLPPERSWKPGAVVDFVYDGTNWNIVSGIAEEENLTLEHIDFILPSALNWCYVNYINGRYFAVERLSQTYAYSDDGLTWAESEFPFSTNSSPAIAYGNGIYVLVSSSSKSCTAYSSDGITWTEATLPVSTDLVSVAYGDGKFVAVSGNTATNIAMYSTDGITWTQSTLPESYYWRQVVYENGKFVAIAMYAANSSNFPNKIAYSSDGITWSLATLPAGTQWCSLAYGAGKFVVITFGKSTALYSDDGITWYKTTIPSHHYTNVAYGAGKFLAFIQNSDKMIYSVDGINWSEITIPINSKWMSVTYDGNQFIAISQDNIVAISEDGLNWISSKDFVSQGDIDVTETLSNALIPIHVGTSAPTNSDIKVWANIPAGITGALPLLPRMTTIDLLADSWTGTTAPYSQEVTINTATKYTKVDLQPTAQQIVDLQSQEIQLMVENDNGICTCYAIGGKPTSDMNMHVLLTEVVPV